MDVKEKRPNKDKEILYYNIFIQQLGDALIELQENLECLYCDERDTCNEYDFCKKDKRSLEE